MKLQRIDGALLAGACAGTARALGWNVWVLRGLFVAFALVKTLWALLAYAAIAVAFQLGNGLRTDEREDRDDLASPELAARNRRIADLERRFRDLEGR